MKNCLICPSCKRPYPVLRILFRPVLWRLTCPYCKARLKFSAASSVCVGLVGVVTIGALILVIGPLRVLQWPILVFFLVFANFFGGFLWVVLGRLELRS